MPRKKGTKAVQTAIAQFLEQVGYVNALHPEPDSDKLFYRTYRLAHSNRPEGYVACHICLKEDPLGSPPFYLKPKEMTLHCNTSHGRANTECDYKSCGVIVQFQEDKDQHHKYIHEQRFGWWIPTD